MLIHNKDQQTPLLCTKKRFKTLVLKISDMQIQIRLRFGMPNSIKLKIPHSPPHKMNFQPQFFTVYGVKFVSFYLIETVGYLQDRI